MLPVRTAGLITLLLFYCVCAPPAVIILMFLAHDFSPAYDEAVRYALSFVVLLFLLQSAGTLRGRLTTWLSSAQLGQERVTEISPVSIDDQSPFTEG
jgi:hypothetical protein